MLIALLSDVHANLPALDAVLEDIAGRPDVAATYHVGDLVGYGPWPNEVVARLRDRAIPGVAGNYDSTVAADSAHCGCKYEDARQEELSHLGYAWTRAHVTPQTKRALGALPFRLDVRPFGGHAAGPTLILVHGTPVLNTVYWTADRSDEFCRKMAAVAGARAGDVIAFGHTHKPWHRSVDGIHFVNTGSVGRPKDGDWRAGYALIDLRGPATVGVDFPRVPYDIARAVTMIEASGLPTEFAGQIEAGGAAVPPAVATAASPNRQATAE
ncbi:MAG TPA: metallophosphoesterase family protein [Gemmatimonadaceae bacterium]|nr:metallophosphoesterase family protein [Gemmatimonadaceae bacterium]